MSLVARYKADDGSGSAAVDQISANNGSLISQELSGAVSAADDNGSGVIRITSAAHGMMTGESVTIADVLGTIEANGTWTITVVDANNFDLDTSTFIVPYVTGGTWTGTTQRWSWSATVPTSPTVPSGSTGSISLSSISTIGTPNVLTIGPTTEFSISCWVRRASIAGARSSAVSQKLTAGSGFQFTLGCDYGTPSKFSIEVGQAAIAVQSAMAINAYDADTWYHLAAVARNNSGTYEAELYINGVSQGSPVVYNETTDGADDTSIGWAIGSEWYDPDGEFTFGWDGMIDEVRIYDEALSQSQINALAGASTGRLAARRNIVTSA